MKIYDENNNLIDTTKFEVVEQHLAKAYIQEDDCVLELGARYGAVSCVINKKLRNKKNHIAVEPDQRVWDALKKNRDINNCEFHVLEGIISKKNVS